MKSLRLLATLAVSLSAGMAHAQTTNPCRPADTTAWNPGPGWETVGNCRAATTRNLRFDAAGTLLTVDGDIDTLDTTGGRPGVWRRVAITPHYLNITGLLPLSTPDSAVAGTNESYRTVNRLQTWTPTGAALYPQTLYATPPGAARAGRLFAGGSSSPLKLSDDRGASWHPPTAYPPGYNLDPTAVAAYPTGPGPWGAGYPGRILAGGFSFGVAVSDDGGDTWRPSGLWTPGYGIYQVAVLARPAAEGGGLRAVATGYINGSGTGCVNVWTSDDGAITWTQRPLLCEPCDAPGCPRSLALLSLAQRQTGGAPVSGAAVAWPETEWETTEALVVLGRGGVFRTTDGGATWIRELGPAGQAPIEWSRNDIPSSATLGPDGRLYVGTVRGGPDRTWMVRTAEGFAVSSSPQAPPQAAPLTVSVRPNPAGGQVTVAVSLASSLSVRVVVLDVRGREVARLHDGPATGALALSLDASGLAPGVYTVRATSEGIPATARLTVTR